MATPSGTPQLNPALIFETLQAHQKTAALKTAIELDVFTAIGEGANTAAALAERLKAAERGMRTLCDYLVIMGFLTKHDQRYALTPESAAFLDQRSPAYLGTLTGFLGAPEYLDRFKNLTAIVRKGGALEDDLSTTEPDNHAWILFARSMAALQRPFAEALAQLLDADAGEKWRVLDIAAGHGIFGVTLAKHNPNAEIYALDWPGVLQVATENAQAAGVAERHHKIPGSAFEVDFGSGYDVILLTGFLHHFDPPTIDTLLRKVHAALAPRGRVVTVEFVPNDDRVTPPMPAAFSIVMLAGTRAGDAYTFSEFDRIFRKAGFSSNELRPGPGPQSFIVSRK
jgi:ubiquinone/menaquinone biosynthesis C-methylase UbiE